MREILPPKKRTRPSNWSQRNILDGILYQLKNGCNWNDLPRDFPPYSTVYWHYKQWRNAGVFDQLMEILHGEVRVQAKKSRWTTLIIVDSQAVKNTCNASAASNGFCSYKATNGIKQHLAVDSLGFPFFTHCTRANVTDDQGLIEMLSDNIDYFRQKPLELAKTTIMLDHGYHPEKIQKALEQIYPEIMIKIEFEVSAKLSKSEKAAQGKKGVVPVAVRWVIERSNSWVERCKNLVKNFEWTLEHARTKLNLCFIRLMIKRLAV